MPTRLVKKLVCYGLLISNHNGVRVFLKSPLNLNNTVRYFIYSKVNQSKAEKYCEIFEKVNTIFGFSSYVPRIDFKESISK